MSSHPVHLINKHGDHLPTALIPFCSFAGDMDILGQEVDGFSVPVCTAFSSSLFFGKLCYTLDINDILAHHNIKLRVGKAHGLSLLIDLNQDRHFGYHKKDLKQEEEKRGHFIKSRKNDGKAKIFLDTLEPLEIIGGGDIALTNIKKITGEKDYYNFASENNICQNEESPTECSARMISEHLSEDCKCVPFEFTHMYQVSYIKKIRVQKN